MSRIMAGFIDYLIAISLAAILALVYFSFSKESANFNSINDIFVLIICMYVGNLYILFRDVISNKSIGKRIFKLKIIDKDTGLEANNKQKVLRNIFLYIFSVINPSLLIVLIIIVFNKGNRIGDMVFRTKVVKSAEINAA